jgi:hypothetical protein
VELPPGRQQYAWKDKWTLAVVRCLPGGRLGVEEVKTHQPLRSGGQPTTSQTSMASQPCLKWPLAENRDIYESVASFLVLKSRGEKAKV